ncbi:MAG TPA: hypothetical protein VGQ81_07590 [Acidobacteriota bacterium]|nr:hypothetical protein [Acidobacteriota bacterium]
MKTAESEKDEQMYYGKSHEGSFPATYPPRETEWETQDDTISLLPIIRTLGEYRKVILVALTTVVGALLIVSVAKYLMSPSQELATLHFHLRFDGIDSGEYPNGMKFSSTDIVATPLLAQVFEANDLGKYTSFERFRNSVFVLESNPDLEKLVREYEAKLSEFKGSPIYRDILEKEYQKKRQTLSFSDYSLNYASEDNGASIPDPLLKKILNDILAIWAENAVQRKGVLKHLISVYSQNILSKDLIEREDYIVAADILRSTINNIVTSIDSISALPGAAVIRTGKQRISLAEVRIRLQNLLRFRLQPLIEIIQANSLSRNPVSARVYLKSRLDQVKLEYQEASEKGKILKDALHQYMEEKEKLLSSGARVGGSTSAAGAQPVGTGDRSIPLLFPQVSDSLLDRLVDRPALNADLKFRQDITERIIQAALAAGSLDRELNYYQQLLASVMIIEKRGRRQSDVAGQAAAEVKENWERSLSGIVESLEQVNAPYQEISAQNLNPKPFLYTITVPAAVSTQNTVKLSTIAFYGFLSTLIAAAIISCICLVHARFRAESTRSSGMSPVRVR